ncbi:YktB family protein [Tigheibacillus jepli]|uniref:YktB family protein n=1 Tax=Tigheibacillus jepli TaxID=3035914 RepID=UPI00387E1AB7
MNNPVIRIIRERLLIDGFNGFDEKDFAIFHIEGLENRMEALQSRLQPKFAELGEELTNHLSTQLGNEMFLHIAKHARRTVNPPDNTWLAIADSKRGYKKHPHFQVGLWDDRVFIWLSLIYELEGKQSIAQSFLERFEAIKKLPKDYVVSLDHMTKPVITLPEFEKKDLERFRDVKKAELLIGKIIPKDNPILQNGKAFTKEAEQTIQTLLPFYHLALRSRNN